jgi:hypothetical protein
MNVALLLVAMLFAGYGSMPMPENARDPNGE